jgi:hypothetical protein
MADQEGRQKRRGLIPLSGLVAQVLSPVTVKRGFASADLLAAWPEIAGPIFADCTAPEKIVWPRRAGKDADDATGVLVLRVDGPKAIYVQHEVNQFLERVNAFLGYAAIGRIRIMQGPVAAKPAGRAEAPPLDASEQAELSQKLSGIESDALRAALRRLGGSILSQRSNGRSGGNE